MTDTSRNPATMTNEELHAHFSALLVSRAEDVDTRLGEFDTKLTNAMDKIDGLEKSFNAKLDVRFKELLNRLPAPAPAPTPGARRIPLAGRTTGSAAAAPPAATAAADAPQTSAAAAATLGADDGYYYDPDDDDLFDEEVEQPPQVPAGRPRYYYRNARPPVRNDDDHVAKLKLNIPSFEGKYNPDAYLTWDMEVEQRFACLKYPENMRVSAATCEFTKFASLWWYKYYRLNPTTIPGTWTALKTAMRVRFVPPTYQRDLLKNLTRLEQGKNSVEEYYQELQTGMVRCGLVESNEQMLARFFGGLNKDIQHILDYKEYNTITRLFHLACKAEREVQDRQTPWRRTNNSAGRTSTWTSRQSAPPSRDSPPATTTSKATTRFPAAPPPSSNAPARSASSMASTGKTKDIQCRKCWGFGHIERQCTTQRVMMVREDGQYDSTSDFDEDTLALISARDGDNSDADEETEVMGAEAADQYKSLITQRVLSVQLSKSEQDQRHNLFQTRGVVKERAIRIIIDGGSCNNLASVDMVEKH